MVQNCLQNITGYSILACLQFLSDYYLYEIYSIISNN